MTTPAPMGAPPLFVTTIHRVRNPRPTSLTDTNLQVFVNARLDLEVGTLS